MSIVEVEALTKSFHKRPVFENISFQVNKGSFTALLGKNGAGKSTVLNILMGQIKLDRGECRLFGQSIQRDPYLLKNKIGHVSENIRFNYPESMEKFIYQYGRLYQNFDFENFFYMANKLDLDLGKQFAEYSRGQKMQIVLLAALSHRPELLLIDEVTAVLDAFARKFLTTMLKKFTENGGTVILTTNIVSEVQYYCSDVIFLSDGKIKFQTSLAEIPAKFKKIRKTDQTDHEIFHSPECIWSGINSDGSQSYIISKKLHDSSNLSDVIQDRRAVTLEDLYIYYSQSEKT